MLQVGILNCIAIAIAVSSLIASLPRARRPGAGIVIRRAGERHIDNAFRWMAIAGCGLVAGGVFFSGQPYTLYPKVDYWVNSPGLIVLVLVAAHVWERGGFSPVRC
jgi:hypothetical protein